MDSGTTDKHPLELSTDNGEEVKQKKCDYVLLSQIRDPRQHPLEPQPPEISIVVVFPVWTQVTNWGIVRSR